MIAEPHTIVDREPVPDIDPAIRRDSRRKFDNVNWFSEKWLNSPSSQAPYRPVPRQPSLLVPSSLRLAASLQPGCRTTDDDGTVIVI